MIGLVLVLPEELVTAAEHLRTVQSDLAAANVMAARCTTEIATAAQDEVSQSLASLFSTHGQQAQAAIAQNAVVGTQDFASRLASAASSYSVTDYQSAIYFLDFLTNLIKFVSGPLGNEQFLESLPIPVQILLIPVEWALFLLLLPLVIPVLVIGIPLLIIALAMI